MPNKYVKQVMKKYTPKHSSIVSIKILYKKIYIKKSKAIGQTEKYIFSKAASKEWRALGVAVSAILYYRTSS